MRIQGTRRARWLTGASVGLTAICAMAATAEAGYGVDTNGDGIYEYYVRTVGGNAPYNYNTIQAAHDACLSSSDILIVYSGTYVENVAWGIPAEIRFDGNVTIQAATSGAAAVIQATGWAPTYFTNVGTGTVRIKPHASATNQRGIRGYTDSQGNPADLVITGITFDPFTVTGDGAAIYNVGAGSVSGCSFSGCTASGNGGAIANARDVASCTFDGCSAQNGSGGAMYAVRDVDDCVIQSCTAWANGGAISSAHSVTDTIIAYCEATSGNGGGVHDVGGTASDTTDVISGSSFTANTAGGYGGGIANSDADVRVCTVDSNSAANHGGGMYAVTGDIDRCVVQRNSAGSNGGGLSGCTGSIRNTLVLKNHADTSGGGLHNCDGHVKQCDILDNTAGDLGGGARSCGGTIKNCIFQGNSDANGGVNSDQLSLSSDPTFSCMPSNWTGGGSNNVKTDSPGFVSKSGTDPTQWNLDLTSTSSCKDKGDNLTNITVDHLNRSRPGSGGQSGKWDIGAFEKQ